MPRTVRSIAVAFVPERDELERLAAGRVGGDDGRRLVRCGVVDARIGRSARTPRADGESAATASGAAAAPTIGGRPPTAARLRRIAIGRSAGARSPAANAASASSGGARRVRASRRTARRHRRCESSAASARDRAPRRTSARSSPATAPRRRRSSTARQAASTSQQSRPAATAHRSLNSTATSTMTSTGAPWRVRGREAPLPHRLDRRDRSARRRRPCRILTSPTDAVAADDDFEHDVAGDARAARVLRVVGLHLAQQARRLDADAGPDTVRRRCRRPSPGRRRCRRLRRGRCRVPVPTPPPWPGPWLSVSAARLLQARRRDRACPPAR